jgi:hypothetical protein
VVVTLLGLACGRDPQPDVILIVLDAVRADHLSLYGYPRSTTPALGSVTSWSSLRRRRRPAHGTASLSDGRPRRGGADLRFLGMTEPARCSGADTNT